MSLVHTIYSAMLTRSTKNSGSHSPIVIIGNQLGLDRIAIVIEGISSQRNRDQGQANLYIDKIGNSVSFLDTLLLSRSYFRVVIGRGDDIWRPENFFLWGIAEAHGRQLVVPLAMGLDLAQTGVTRSGSGRPDPDILDKKKVEVGTGGSFPLPPVSLGNGAVPIQGLLFVLLTADSSNAGTNDQVKFTIQTPNGEMAFDVPRDTEQDDQEKGQANFYGPEFFPIPIPFTKGSLGPDAIRLFIGGRDAWLPQALYLFGLDTPSGQQPSMVVPLVHLEGQPVGVLSTDTGEGQPSAVLPLCPQ
jgi:hypothetical protein